jgi:nickel-dependent lactate racemase
MQVRLAYGTAGLTVELPDERTTVIEPEFVPGLPDERAALAAALASPDGTPPLCDLVRSEDSVVIVFPDMTRAMPNERVLPVLLAALDHVPAERITLLNANGLHRENTPEELAQMLGPELLRRYRVVNHRGYAQEELISLGRTSLGGDVWLNGEYVRATKRIVTGFIEPHFFAGFSGGPKMVCPGVAGSRTTLHAHNAAMIGHPNATWGVTEGNPIYDEIREAAALAPPHFSLSVTLNKRHEITNIFAGELFATHRAGCAYVKATAMQSVTEPFDVVISTNSGYPLDLNLYQAVKGMSAAAQIVRPGGAIIMAAACSQGVPAGSHYQRLLALESSPAALLQRIESPGFHQPEQWQVQVQALIQAKARVYLKADGVSDAEIRAAHLLPCADIAQKVAALLAEYGAGARLAVLPQGPQTIPYLSPQGERSARPPTADAA